MKFASVSPTFSALAVSALACFPAGAAILRVNAAAVAPFNGSSFTHGFPTVHAALSATQSGDEVWVEKGTYTETVAVPSGVKLLGGFAGSETTSDQADPATNDTILDGNHAGSVISIPANASSGTVINGFTILNGSGTVQQQGTSGFGGGVFCGDNSFPTITNNIFIANAAKGTVGAWGGAIYCGDLGGGTISHNVFYANTSSAYSGAIDCQRSSPTISDNVFSFNTAVNDGGAISVLNYSTALIIRNQFTKNSSGNGDGGAVYCGQNAQPAIVDNVFTQNTAGEGGAIDTYLSGIPTHHLTVLNNIFDGDGAGHGGGVYLYGAVDTINNTIFNATGGALYISSSDTVANNIVSGNDTGVVINSALASPAFNHNDVYGNTTANYSNGNPTGQNGNISVDPLIVNGAGGDFHLQLASPCVDAGDSSQVPDLNGVENQDVYGAGRFFGGAVDIGAAECYPTLTFSTQPGGALATSALNPQPTVTVAYPGGHDTGIPVTLALKGGTAGASLGGTATKTAVNGVAQFSGLAVLKGGVGYVLTAESPGCAPVDSTPFTVTLRRLYVSTHGDDAHAGDTWQAAKRNVQAALDEADTHKPGAEVWVAHGKYGGAIVIPNGVSVYGGFKGSEDSRAERDFRLNTTILNAGGDSAATVRFDVGNGRNTAVDGFTISGGKGNPGRGGGTEGGGVYCERSDAAIRNDIITGNSATNGGGIFVENTSPTITNDVITENAATGLLTAPGEGGGIRIEGTSSALVTDSLITHNTASGLTRPGGSGAAVSVSGGSPAIRDNTIANNDSSGANATVDLQNASPVLTNNIIAFNGGGVGSVSAAPTFSHNDVYSNTTNFTGLSDPTGSNGNIAADPLFVAAGSDYRLTSASPCRDAGDDGVTTAGELDVSGEPRISGPQVDIGAYELAIAPYTLTDAETALKIAGGMEAAGDVQRFDPLDRAAVTLDDAMEIARKADGLDPNP